MVEDKIQYLKKKTNILRGFSPSRGKRSPDGFRIDTGNMIGITGIPVYKWDRDIPYEEFKNEHTKEPVTAEQIEAVKYFVNEENNAYSEVWQEQKSEVIVDGMIRSRLFSSTNLSETVTEYKKEMSDKNYQSQRRQARVAKERNKKQTYLKNAWDKFKSQRKPWE